MRRFHANLRSQIADSDPRRRAERTNTRCPSSAWPAPRSRTIDAAAQPPTSRACGRHVACRLTTRRRLARVQVAAREPPMVLRCALAIASGPADWPGERSFLRDSVAQRISFTDPSTNQTRHARREHHPIKGDAPGTAIANQAADSKQADSQQARRARSNTVPTPDADGSCGLEATAQRAGRDRAQAGRARDCRKSIEAEAD